MAQAFLIQSKTFTLCNILVAIEFSNFKHFDYIRIFKYRAFLFYLLSKWTLDGKKFEIEREIVAEDQDFCSRLRKIRDTEVRDKEIKIA